MPSNPVRESGRSLVPLVLLFVGFSMLMKVPTLIFEHDEPDERVYWAVAENLAQRGEYTLRGSPMLEGMSPRIYDRPLFHHPPLYIALLVPFTALDAPQAAVTISWIGHALCIVAVALMGATLLRRSGTPAEELGSWLWIPLLGVATDPLLAFASRKLWIDALMSGLVALSVALVFRARYARERRRTWLVAAGACLGLAGLAKLPGLLAGVIGVVLLLSGGEGRQRRLRDLLFYAAPAALLVLPWMVIFFNTYGVLAPDWLTPDQVSFDRYRFVSKMVDLPWFYYIVKLCIAQPLVLLVGLAYVLSPRRGPGPARWVPALWFLLFISVATYQGMTGYGFQMRYVTPLSCSVYVGLLCFPALIGPRERLRVTVIVLVIFYAAMGGAMYLLDSRYDELLTIPELMGILNF